MLGGMSFCFLARRSHLPEEVSGRTEPWHAVVRVGVWYTEAKHLVHMFYSDVCGTKTVAALLCSAVFKALGKYSEGVTLNP